MRRNAFGCRAPVVFTATQRMTTPQGYAQIATFDQFHKVAPLTITPENECPTRTVGPICRARTRCPGSNAASNVVRGFWTALTLRPAA